MALASAVKHLKAVAGHRGSLQPELRWVCSSVSPKRQYKAATSHIAYDRSSGASNSRSFSDPKQRNDSLLAVAAAGLSTCVFWWVSSRSSSRSSRGSKICLCASPSSLGGSEVYVWGTNIDGQLGVGSTLSVPLPARLAALPLRAQETVCAVSAGSRISACVTSEGRVFAWGRGAEGETGGASAADGPREVPLPLQEGDRAVAVSCGSSHSLVVTEMGCLYTWGSNTHGQCGRPPCEDPHDSRGVTSAPSPLEGMGRRDVFGGRVGPLSSLPPGRVGGPLAGRKIVGASCGDRVSAAVTAEGDVFVWGECRAGGPVGGGKSRGFPGHELRQVHLPAEGPGGPAKAIAVACGESHCLALSSGGRVYAWGSNTYGQLGLGGAPRIVEQPQLITTLREHRVSAIACGALHSLCITEEGTVFVWGYGRDGQCAQGSRLDVPLPLQVEAGGPAGGPLGGPRMGPCTHISGGEGHSLAVCGAGRLFMWGRGREGQLGRGALIESPAASRDSPVEVCFAEGRQVAAAACGGCHTIACTICAPQ